MGIDQLWGGMFIKSDLQFQKSKAFLSVYASERDFCGVKSFILCQEDLWGTVLLRGGWGEKAGDLFKYQAVSLPEETAYLSLHILS